MHFDSINLRPVGVATGAVAFKAVIPIACILLLIEASLIPQEPVHGAHRH